MAEVKKTREKIVLDRKNEISRAISICRKKLILKHATLCLRKEVKETKLGKLLGIISVTVYRRKNYNGFLTPWVRDKGMFLQLWKKAVAYLYEIFGSGQEGKGTTGNVQE